MKRANRQFFAIPLNYKTYGKDKIMFSASRLEIGKSMPQRILVTGGAGFIGSHFVQSCLALGYEVLVVDSLLPNLYSSDLKIRNLDLFRNDPNVEVLEKDLCKLNMKDVVSRVDVIVNFAAMPGLMPSWHQFETYLNSNVLALSRILDSVEANSNQKIIQISTSSVYGKIAIGNEQSETKPISPYGVTKLAAENLIRVIADQKNLDFNILRLFSVYGPRQRPDMAYDIVTRKILASETVKIFGDGESTRSNTYVDDVVNGIHGSIKSGIKGETYNICGSESFSLNSVLSMIEEITGKKANRTYLPPRPGDQAATRGDFAKASKDFNYHPKTKLIEGLENQIRWIAKDIP
jgi:nucleoside-diphosphate-sugar epimerase